MTEKLKNSSPHLRISPMALGNPGLELVKGWACNVVRELKIEQAKDRR